MTAPSADFGSAELASEAFARLVAGPVRPRSGVAPASLIGLEHEFVVTQAGHTIDFRKVIRDLPLDGRRLDPGDVNATRCSWGGVVTADDREAEIATPPIARRPGFTVRLERAAALGKEELQSALAPSVELSGYSTHLSVAMDADLSPGACQLFLATFAPGLMLLTDTPQSPGLLVRPRSGRMEVAFEYVEGADLRAATAYTVGAVMAVAASIRSVGTAVALPPRLLVHAVTTADRVGWGLRRTAFGEDLLRTGRAAVVRTADGDRMTAGQHLAIAWEIARRTLGRSAGPADLAAADERVSSAVRLPMERGTAFTSGDGVPVSTSAATELGDVRGRRTRGGGVPRSPFGDVLRARSRGPLRVEPVIATWDTTVFAISGGVRSIYAAVPRASLRRFLDGLDRGLMDAVLAAYERHPSGRRLDGWLEAVRPGLYDDIAVATSFIAPEFVYDATTGLPVVSTVPADRGGDDRAGKPAFIVEEPTTAMPKKPRRPWVPWIVGTLIGLTVLVGGGLVLTDGGRPGLTPTPSAPLLVTPAPSPGIPSAPPATSPSATGPQTATPGPTPAAPSEAPSPAVSSPSPTPTPATATPTAVTATSTPTPATATATPTPAAATPAPTPVTPSLPPPAVPTEPVTFSGRGQFQGTLVATGGNLQHEQFGRIAGPRTIVAEQTDIKLTSGNGWIAVVGQLATNGTFTATGSGTYAGFPGVGVRFTGTITFNKLVGDYVVGTAGELPGGQSITYHFVGSRTDAPALPVPSFLERFLAAFVPAQRSNDSTYLVDQLHPAVTDLYGLTQCRASIDAAAPDPSYAITVSKVTGPGSWAYNPDGRSIPVASVYTVTATVTSGGQKASRVLHFGWVDGELRWFTDCGAPLP